MFITAWALASVRVTPGQATLPAGVTCAFAAALDGAQPPGGWRWSVQEGQGEIDEQTWFSPALWDNNPVGTCRAPGRSVECGQ